MGKRRRPRRGAVKVFPASYNASLIHGHRGVDRRYPLGLQATPGGPYLIFPGHPASRNKAAQNTDPVPETQDHGKRGLTVARAQGPDPIDEIAKASPTMSPASIPRSRVKLRLRELEKERFPDKFVFADWQGATRKQGFDRFNFAVLKRLPRYEIAIFMSGSKYFFVREQFGMQSISVTYDNREYAMDKYRNSNIDWKEAYELPPSDDS